MHGPVPKVNLIILVFHLFSKNMEQMLSHYFYHLLCPFVTECNILYVLSLGILFWVTPNHYNICQYTIDMCRRL